MKAQRYFTFVVMLMIAMLLSGCTKNTTTKNLNQISYPISSEVFTTLDRTVLPVPVPLTSPKLQPTQTTLYVTYGYGVWEVGPGLPVEKRLDLMPPGYQIPTHRSTLLRFFTISDVHITDEESPAGTIMMGLTREGNAAAYSPAMLFSTQFLDSTVQTINALHHKNPFDFGISLGDDCNNAQYNELRWFIDTMDGKVINPDSGAKEDPVPGPYNDYQDEFKSAGLDPEIPWYQTYGNHDNFWMGSWPHNEYLALAHTGEDILNIGKIFTDPLHADSRGYYVGVIDGSTEKGEVIGAGPVESTPHLKVVADPNRRSLTRKEWMREFLITSTAPIGHGFTEANLKDDFACYSFEPKSNFPIKVIVLDDLQRSDIYDVHTQGSLDEKRYQWLIRELEEGQKEDKLMIIASHVPLTMIGNNVPDAYIDTARLLKKLQTSPGYPNLILWIAGHAHRNLVTALKSPNTTHPENGFWQVETASLKNFPQQFRTFDILLNRDSISILTTNVDPSVRVGSLSALSRTNAIAAWEIFVTTVFNPIYLPPTGAYNAELVKMLSPAMQKKMEILP